LRQRSMSEIQSQTSTPSARKPVLDGWPLIALIVAFVVIVVSVAVVLRTHHAAKAIPKAAALAGAIPTWPLKSGDVFTIKSGDPAIAKWADQPDSTGMVVQEIEQEGDTITDGKVCTLQPDFMADAAQPGGTLKLLSQDGAGDWQVRWSGGDTRDTEAATGASSVSCGKSAIILMSMAQLHSWWNMQSGNLDAKTPDSDGSATH
jgi:hypothetical protein